MSGPAMTSETPLDRFRSACGLGAPMVLSYGAAPSSAGESTIFRSPTPFLMIGRSPKNHLTLPDGQVSRRHAYLQAVAGWVACIDLKSRTKTFWNDEPEARPWGWLDPGRSIRIGPYRIERTDRQPGEGDAHTPLDPFAPMEGQGLFPDPIPRPVFELPFRMGGVASTWEMPGLLALVGREDHCQLMLEDDSISRSHACLVRTPMGAWVVDLEAREGVHVNGARVRWAWLADGDVVRFGLFTMVVRYDRKPEGIDRDAVPLEAGATQRGSPGDRRQGDVEPTGGPGRGLALRPVARPPGLRKPAGQQPAGFHPTEPATLDRGEWEAMPGMGFNPYALWQQQMQLMESFHNDMTMMVQMFIAMHREFQSSVREELERVQKLTSELSRLNARLIQIPESPGTSPDPSSARPEAQAGPAPPRGRPAPEATSAPRTLHRTDPPAGPKPAVRYDQADTARPEPIAGEPQDAANGPAPPRESAEMYADITRRITELQRQRRGYWQRILKAING